MGSLAGCGTALGCIAFVITRHVEISGSWRHPAIKYALVLLYHALAIEIRTACLVLFLSAPCLFPWNIYLLCLSSLIMSFACVPGGHLGLSQNICAALFASVFGAYSVSTASQPLRRSLPEPLLTWLLCVRSIENLFVLLISFMCDEIRSHLDSASFASIVNIR